MLRNVELLGMVESLAASSIREGDGVLVKPRYHLTGEEEKAENNAR